MTCREWDCGSLPYSIRKNKGTWKVNTYIYKKSIENKTNHNNNKKIDRRTQLKRRDKKNYILFS